MAGLSFVAPRPDHASHAAVGGDDQPVHLHVERPVHPLRDDDPRASRRARSGWPSGPARSGPSSVRSSPRRIGRRIGLGPAYALGCIIFPASLLLIPIAGPGMPMPLILALLFGSEFGAGFGVMILDINVGAIIYARTPDRIRARAGGAFRFVNYGVRPIGALLGGLLGGGDRRARGHRGRDDPRHRRRPVPGRLTRPELHDLPEESG